jgi:hypothetical protein
MRRSGNLLTFIALLCSLFIIMTLTTASADSSNLPYGVPANDDRHLQFAELLPQPTLLPLKPIQAGEPTEAYFMFDCPEHPETFIFKLTDPARIEQARAILNGTAHGIVAGAIIRQPVYYNTPWSFYLDPKSISFPETATEVCDSSIKGIEDHLNSAYPTWCSWCTRLVREIPPPPKPGTGNLSPAVSMMTPYINNLPKLSAPATITLMAAADDPDGAISKVEFYDGYKKIGEDSTYPYSFTWSNIAAGSYPLSARAYDNAGATASSRSIIFTVGGSNSNPIDETSFFVRQHYLDFLSREPDPGGFQGWINIINNCPAGSIACDRIEVSSAFFRSPEFRDRGYFVYKLYAASLGRNPAFPRYSEFIPDLAKVSGFLTPEELDASKTAFAEEFVKRAEFQTRYDATSNAQYVDLLLQTAGVSLTQRDNWIAALNSNQKTRARVLRELAESPEVDAKFYVESFVVMQYFGYLKRDPDALYVNWIQTMKADPNNYRQMVNGFVNSAEYRFRFGS